MKISIELSSHTMSIRFNSEYYFFGEVFRHYVIFTIFSFSLCSFLVQSLWELDNNTSKFDSHIRYLFLKKKTWRKAIVATLPTAGPIQYNNTSFKIVKEVSTLTIVVNHIVAIFKILHQICKKK